jgi:putative redox protein
MPVTLMTKRIPPGDTGGKSERLVKGDGAMAQNGHRQVSIARDAVTKYTATNERGGTISVGTGGDEDFTPVELLLAAIGGCTAIDVDVVTSRRAEPASFSLEVEAEKIRDTLGSRLTDIAVTFRVSFPEGAGGDAARALLPDAVRRSHDSICTVSKTIELGTPVTLTIAETA